MLPGFVAATIAGLASSVSTAALGHDLEGTALRARSCDSETESLLCYTGAKGMSQDVTVADVTFIAKYLRAYGRQTKPGRFFTMNAKDTQGCGEWTVYSRRSTLVTIKHIDDRIDSSVLFEDIATTIDGGEKATAEEQLNFLLGCGTDGGAFTVQANLTNPAYADAAYVGAGYKTGGLLVKVVKNTEQEEV